MADIPQSVRPPRRPDEDRLELIRSLTRDNPYMDPLAELGLLHANLPNTLNVLPEGSVLPSATTRMRQDGPVHSITLSGDLANPYVMAHELRHVGMRQLIAAEMAGDMSAEDSEFLASTLLDIPTYMDDLNRGVEFTVELLDDLYKMKEREVEVPRGGIMGALFGGTLTGTETYNEPKELYGAAVRRVWDDNEDALRALYGADLTADSLLERLYGNEYDLHDVFPDAEARQRQQDRAVRLQGWAAQWPGMGL